MLRIITILSLMASLVIFTGCSEDTEGDDGDSGGAMRIITDSNGNLHFADPEDQ